MDHATGKVSDEVTYMTADVEDQYVVAQAAEPTDENGCLVNERITCRHRDEIIEVDRDRVDFIDISPRMMVSIATAMIPFLPNDDANRALMGANMQRQAVPLLRPEAPIIGTGMEHKICIDSEVALLAEGDGEVTRVDACGVSPSSSAPTTAPASTSGPSCPLATGSMAAMWPRTATWRTPPSWPTVPPPIRARSLWAGTSWWAS